jgi:phosphohistidine phosphatase
MTVYLVRHAIAEERGPAWPDDRERPLTARGIARMRKIARRLAERGVHVDRVWSSPLQRARQTADLLVPIWTTTQVVDIVPELAPGRASAHVGASLAALGTPDAVAVVGHEPDLGQLAAWMIGTRSPLPFKKGGVARVEFPDRIEAGAGQLVWLVTPKLVLGEEAP